MSDLLLDVAAEPAGARAHQVSRPAHPASRAPRARARARGRRPLCVTERCSSARRAGQAGGRPRVNVSRPAGADPFVGRARGAPRAVRRSGRDVRASRAHGLGARRATRRSHGARLRRERRRRPRGALRGLYDFFHAHAAKPRALGARRRPRSRPRTARPRSAPRRPRRSKGSCAAREGDRAQSARRRTSSSSSRGAEARVAPVLRFVLSPRSAFVTAQPIVVTTRARGAGGARRSCRSLEKKTALVTGAARGIGERDGAPPRAGGRARPLPRLPGGRRGRRASSRARSAARRSSVRHVRTPTRPATHRGGGHARAAASTSSSTTRGSPATRRSRACPKSCGTRSST